jgi:hypothetical protein
LIITIAVVNIILMVFVVLFIIIKIFRKNIGIKTIIILLLLLAYLVRIHINGNRYVTINRIENNINWVIESLKRETGRYPDKVDNILDEPLFKNAIKSPIVETKFGLYKDNDDIRFYSFGYDNDDDNCGKLYKNKIYMIFIPYFNGDILLKEYHLR